MSGDLDVYALRLSFTFVVILIFVRAVFAVVDGSPLAAVGDFRVWDVEVVVFFREFVRHPATLLVVVLDNIPEAVHEVKFDRDKRAFIVYVVSLCVPFWCEYC